MDSRYFAHSVQSHARECVTAVVVSNDSAWWIHTSAGLSLLSLHSSAGLSSSLLKTFKKFLKTFTGLCHRPISSAGKRHLFQRSCCSLPSQVWQWIPMQTSTTCLGPVPLFLLHRDVVFWYLLHLSGQNCKDLFPRQSHEMPTKLGLSRISHPGLVHIVLTERCRASVQVRELDVCLRTLLLATLPPWTEGYSWFPTPGHSFLLRHKT